MRWRFKAIDKHNAEHAGQRMAARVNLFRIVCCKIRACGCHACFGSAMIADFKSAAAARIRLAHSVFVHQRGYCADRAHASVVRKLKARVVTACKVARCEM